MVQPTQLRFEGSVWCNLDIALRNLDQLFGRAVKPLGLTIIEWYILRSLYERDAQHASELARAVGRAATSFTPNLDKLAGKDLVERRPDPADRRAVLIHLTEKGQALREDVLSAAEDVDSWVQQLFGVEEFETFLSVLGALQTLEPIYKSEASSNGRHHETLELSSFSRS